MPMNEFDYKGCLAFSLAGHDKGRIYVIIDTEGDTAFLSDGCLKPVTAPKKKKLKHLQPVKKTYDYYLKLFDDLDIEEGHMPTNEEVARAIKLFKRKGKEED